MEILYGILLVVGVIILFASFIYAIVTLASKKRRTRLFTKLKYIFRFLLSVQRGIYCKIRKYAPHQVHPDFLYWQKDDDLTFKNGKIQEYRDFAEESLNYKFIGFLENSAVIGTGLSDSYKEIPAWKLLMYDNSTCRARIRRQQTDRLKNRIENSEYNRFLGELRAGQEESFQAFKELNSKQEQK